MVRNSGFPTWIALDRHIWHLLASREHLTFLDRSEVTYASAKFINSSTAPIFSCFSFALVLTACALVIAQAQTAAPAQTPRSNAPAQSTQPAFDLAEYGVRLEPDQRLIVVMAAL